MACLSSTQDQYCGLFGVHPKALLRVEDGADVTVLERDSVKDPTVLRTGQYSPGQY